MKTSIIICVYNEVKTISGAVKSCCSHNPDAEVIVVDYGSEDEIEANLRKLSNSFSFKYEKLTRDMGKGWAMVHGVERATNEIIVFIDADTTNIKKHHFESLVTPILNNEADMVLGEPYEILKDYRLSPYMSLTKERAMLKEDLEPVLNYLRDIRFGVENFINLHFQYQGKRVKFEYLDGIKHPEDDKKNAFLNGTKGFPFEDFKSKIDIVRNDINSKLIELKEKFQIQQEVYFQDNQSRRKTG